MKKKIKAVKKFHKAFGIGFEKEPIAKLPENKLQLRFDNGRRESRIFRGRQK